MTGRFDDDLRCSRRRSIVMDCLCSDPECSPSSAELLLDPITSNQPWQIQSESVPQPTSHPNQNLRDIAR